MNTDWYIDQGYSHKICEDYAVVGDGFAIISDGCSSSKYTDIGARVLCMSAREILTRFLRDSPEQPLDCRFFKNYVIGRAASSIENLGLPFSCLDATLLIAFVHIDVIYVYSFGDGYIAITYKDGKREYWKAKYPKNAPYYPSYSLDFARDELYRDQVGHKFSVTRSKDLEKDVIDVPIDRTHFVLRNVEEVSNVLILSDGVESFLDKSSGVAEPIPDTEILDTLTNFKLTKGEFVRRRANAAMKKFKKEEITHYDDLAIGGLNFD